MRLAPAALLAWVILSPTAAAQDAMDSAFPRFYAGRSWQPAWVSANGLTVQADQLLSLVSRSGRDGLDSADYLSPALDSLLHRDLTPEEAWRLDSLLTRTFLSYAHDLSRGRLDPAAVDTQWTAAGPTLDLAALLDLAANADAADKLLAAAAPPQPGYRTLRAGLRRYRDLAERGPWPPDLKQRLAVEGYDTTAGIPAAVREFQRLHGLVADGIVGPATRAALGVSAAARADQIALNLERWRWLPRALGERYIVVNSAAFTLDLVEDDTSVWTARAIVGRLDWPTPIVSGRATHVLFRPRWKVPRVIAARELLPLIQRDTAYVRQERFHVYADTTLASAELDPHAIDWTAVTESTFAYQLVQDPGGGNPLGGLKLVFWNPFTVFIHDTPARQLFSERQRIFSHGCVRVEHAADLAALLMPGWSADSIRTAMRTGRERWVRLPRVTPVHLVYWTAWAAENGLVAFAGDPYGWDEKLAAALRMRDASSVTLEGGRR